MRTQACLLCETEGPSRPENHLCDDCIEQGKLYARLRKRNPRRRKKKNQNFWLSFIGLDQRIVDEIRFRFKKRFSKTEPDTEDEKDFVQQLFLTSVKARKRYNPNHASTANLYTFINRSLDRHTRYLDRTRLSDSRAVNLYAEDPEAVHETDWFFVTSDMRHEHYRQLNGERKYSQKPPHFNLGLDITCFAEEPWADASSLRQRTTEKLQLLSSTQRMIFELLVTGHTQEEIADNLGLSQGWISSQANSVRHRFGQIVKNKKNQNFLLIN